ncbi:MAG: glutamyl-tRNA reductase [Chloroflexi bacterium]|nr:glutamyl-tRNA reductase [Chloroflexota bacterium]
MHLLVVGLSHKTAPVEVRERLAFTPAILGPALARLRRYVLEGAVLSTCNRAEVYALVGHRSTGEDSVRRFIGDAHGVPTEQFAPYVYVRSQNDAVRHLFHVASGLDSMVLGEPQILGQVREAHERAAQAGTAQRVVEQLFRQAVTVGKRARTQTGIARRTVSVSHVAVMLARQIFGDLGPRTALIVGAGEMGAQTARALTQHGVTSLLVANRTPARSRRLSAALGGEWLPFERLDEALARADVVVVSTSARERVIDAEQVRHVMGGRPGRPLFIIDIGLPRNVASEVGDLVDVYVYDLDDLQAICDANLRERAQEAEKVRRLIDDEVEKFARWWQALEVVPTIGALRAQAEGIRAAEVQRALAKLGHLSERDRRVVQALSGAIVNKLLHTPITRLKEHDEGRLYSVVLRELFGLATDAAEPGWGAAAYGPVDAPEGAPAERPPSAARPGA